MRRVREGLLGPSYFYHRHLIQKSKGWSAEEIRDYQERWTQYLTARYSEQETRKEDYREDLTRYTRWNLPVVTHTVRTGGTSGQPLHFRADTFARRQKERAYLFDIWSQIGYAPYDLRVCFRGDVHNSLIRFDSLENVWFISPDVTTEEDIRALRHWVCTLPPFFLHVHPSSLFTLIDLLGEHLFRSLPIRGVIAASEAFPSSQRAQFEQAFGLPVAHWYGHTEYATLAYCCQQCRGFHFYPTYGQVELLASDVDECRRVVASSYNRIGTQFVRYDTGDLALASTEDCTADNFLRAAAIVGRTQETFIDKTGRRRSLFGFVFGDEKSAIWDLIRDLQFEQEKVGALRARFVVSPGADRGKIEQFFEKRMPMVSLDFEYVNAIERTSSGKRRYFVDHNP
jgi:phenylacetate-CoA ligase